MIDTKLLILIAENTGDQCNVHTVRAFIKEYEKEINAYRKENKRLRKNFELSRKAHKRYTNKLKLTLKTKSEQIDKLINVIEFFKYHNKNLNKEQEYKIIEALENIQKYG